MRSSEKLFTNTVILSFTISLHTRSVENTLRRYLAAHPLAPYQARPIGSITNLLRNRLPKLTLPAAQADPAWQTASVTPRLMPPATAWLMSAREPGRIGAPIPIVIRLGQPEGSIPQATAERFAPVPWAEAAFGNRLRVTSSNRL